MKLLWENAATATAFAAQKLSLDLTGYSVLLTEYSYDSTEGKVHLSQIATNTVGDSYRLIFMSGNSSTTSYSQHRDIEIVEDGLSVGGGYRTGSTNDAACSPRRIYGLKGVQGRT